MCTSFQQENAASATDKVKAGVGSLLTGISRALVIEPEDKDDPGEPITTYDRAQVGGKRTTVKLWF